MIEGGAPHPVGARTGGGTGFGRAGVTLVLCLLLGGTGAAAQSDTHDQAIGDLESPDTRTRIDALRTLGESGRREAVSSMAALLLDGDEGVQREAIGAILGLYTVPGDLDDRVWGPSAEGGRARMRAEAAFEAGPLAAIPGPVPADVLTGLSAVMRQDESGRTRLLAAYALGVLGAPHMGQMPEAADRQVATDVVYALRHPDEATREAVARVAGRLYRHGPGMREPVAVGDALIGAMNDRDALVRRWAMDSLGWLRYGRAVQALTERNSYYGEGEEGASALHALARIAHPGSSALFRSLLSGDFLPFRVISIEGLARLEECSALPAIEESAASARDAGVSLAAQLARYRCGQGDLAPIVAGLDRRATEMQARVYLEEIGVADPAALSPLLTSANPAIRVLAVRIVGASKKAEQENALQPLLQDREPPVVDAVSEAIQRLRAYGGTAPVEQ